MVTKTVRNVVRIDEEKCNGCGLCITACAEGALRIIDGKARLISEKYCDGLGNCLKCPEGAISIEQRAAEDFDEAAVARHLESEKEETAACGCASANVAQFLTQEPDRAVEKVPDSIAAGSLAGTAGPGAADGAVP